MELILLIYILLYLIILILILQIILGKKLIKLFKMIVDIIFYITLDGQVMIGIDIIGGIILLIYLLIQHFK